MKIKGRKITGPNREIIAIPRSETEDIIFIAEAILDHSPFDKLCPPPKPKIKKIGGQDIPDIKDPNYLKNVNTYSEKKTAWLILEALKATEDLEWETVDLGDPSTWLNFRQELRDAGFSDFEINMVINGALGVQGLNEAKIEAARERFLHQRQAQLELLSSLREEQSSMPSGEPANS